MSQTSSSLDKNVAKACEPYKTGLISIPPGFGMTKTALHLLVSKKFAVSIVVVDRFRLDQITHILIDKKEGGPWTLSTKNNNAGVQVVTSSTQVVVVVSRQWATKHINELFNKLVSSIKDETIKMRIKTHGKIDGVVVMDLIMSIHILKDLFTYAQEGWAFNQGNLILKDRVLIRFCILKNITSLFDKLVNSIKDKTIKMRTKNHGKIDGIVVMEDIAIPIVLPFCEAL